MKVAGSCTVELEEVISEGAGSATPMRGKFLEQHGSTSIGPYQCNGSATPMCGKSPTCRKTAPFFSGSPTRLIVDPVPGFGKGARMKMSL